MPVHRGFFWEVGLRRRNACLRRNRRFSYDVTDPSTPALGNLGLRAHRWPYLENQWANFAQLFFCWNRLPSGSGLTLVAMMKIRFQNPSETTSETSTNKGSAAIELFESRYLEDDFRYANIWTQVSNGTASRLADSHKKKVGLNASTGSRDIARDLLLGKSASDRLGNRFFGIALTL